MNKNESFDPVTAEFIRTHRNTCACVPALTSQKIWYGFLLAGMLCLLRYRWDLFVFLAGGYFILIYSSAVFLRAAAAFLCLTGKGACSVTKKELSEFRDSELPVYTILVPLYKEPEVAAKILKRIAALSYPKDKLDVKLLLEHDDASTWDALRAGEIPPYVSVMRLEGDLPKTKPRACNFGLKEAKGEFCVIYDAEDIPESDQLKKVLSVFKRDSTGRIACVQAKLNYYNSKQNWLTRFFTIEYSTYFDLVLGGWNKFGVPLPLGGTSNHFRTDVLKRLGGWDPFNVTEDCELGIRIYEGGWKTELVDSTTWEEANSQLFNWLRQRSRWVKGFIQTHLSHFRNPVSIVRRLGWKGAFGCYLSVGGGAVMMLTNVIFWPITLFYLFLALHAWCSGESLANILIMNNSVEKTYAGINLFGHMLKPWPLIYTGADESLFWSVFSIFAFVCSIFLLFSNLLLVLVHSAACVKRKFYYLIPWSFLMPFYWILISIGAWKGFLQLFTKPFYWEKTVHGLDQQK